MFKSCHGQHNVYLNKLHQEMCIRDSVRNLSPLSQYQSFIRLIVCHLFYVYSVKIMFVFFLWAVVSIYGNIYLSFCGEYIFLLSFYKKNASCNYRKLSLVMELSLIHISCVCTANNYIFFLLENVRIYL